MDRACKFIHDGKYSFCLCLNVFPLLKHYCLYRSIRHLQEASSTDGKGKNPDQSQPKKFHELNLWIYSFNLVPLSFSCHELGEAQALPALLCDGKKFSLTVIFSFLNPSFIHLHNLSITRLPVKLKFTTALLALSSQIALNTDVINYYDVADIALMFLSSGIKHYSYNIYWLTAFGRATAGFSFSRVTAAEPEQKPRKQPHILFDLFADAYH